MPSLPGWDSLESVSAIHRGAEIAGMAFLGLLLVAEVLAFTYSDRKDALVAQGAQRRLSRRQQEALVAALSPFPGQKGSVVCIWGDTEGKQFAEDFVSVLVNARWDLQTPPGAQPGVNQATYGDPDPVGVLVVLNPEGINANIAQAERALVASLAQLHLIQQAGAVPNTQTAIGTIEIVVGRKPAPNGL